ncbi:hypothetical protein HZC30_01150 [Candidatus Woesearchaeota archaeon]|nr:hypothetical protein [Candidatus Woesearchaeota archaeon]
MLLRCKLQPNNKIYKPLSYSYPIKEEKMKNKLVLWLLVVVLVISTFVIAQEPFPCGTDEDCIYNVDNESYCDPTSLLCVPPPPEIPPEESLYAPPAPAIETSAITSLQLQIDTLQISLDELSSQINLLGSDTNYKLADIEAKLQSLSDKLNALKSKDIPTFNTGLAMLQQDVNETSAELSSVQEELDRKGFVLYSFLVVVLLMVLGGVVYYLWYKTGESKEVALPRSSYAYITKMIKQGKKFPHIKTELIKAGWSDEEIEQAYKETTKHNYQRFLQRSQPGTAAKISASPSSFSHPKTSSFNPQIKAVAIAVVCLILLGGGILLLGNTVGKAIYFQKLIGGSTTKTAGEITYTVECTPPHRLNPEQNGCCLDVNNNAQCDNLENLPAPNITGPTAGTKCLDHQQCGADKCINNLCTPPTYYTKSLGSCSKVCNYYSVEVITSDGERYNLRPGEGSYTAAGALDWTIMKAPNHCIEESVVVPIEISRKKTGGKIINTELITLGKGETSATLKHAFVPKLGFTLKVNWVSELCAPNEAELKASMIKQGLAEAKLKAKG